MKGGLGEYKGDIHTSLSVSRSLHTYRKDQEELTHTLEYVHVLEGQLDSLYTPEQFRVTPTE